MFQNVLQSDWINMGDVVFQAREQDMELACGLEIVHANRGEKFEKKYMNIWGRCEADSKPTLRAKWYMVSL